MVDPNKSIVIFSHPRCASTWFQQSLTQFSLDELFLLRNHVFDYDINKLLIRYVTPKMIYEDPAKELERRFDIYSYYASKKPVSIKIHTFLLDDAITDFLHKQDTQYVILNRKNKIDTFWSALISWHTANWHKTAIPMNLTVKKNYFEHIVSWMNNYDDECNKIKSLFDVKELYFEDYINYPESEWFHPDKVLVQNAKKVTIIDNLDEVNQWINETKIFK
jgi:hypothetical protein